MFLVAFPVSYLLAFVLDLGLDGLWIGYGASAACLTLLYAKVITSLDWCKVASEASSTDEKNYAETESTQEDDDYKRVYTSTDIGDMTDDFADNYKRTFSPLFTHNFSPTEPDSSPFSSL